MQILIATIADDLHAEAVAMVLEQRGHRALLVHGADFPQHQCATLSLDERDVRFERHGAALTRHDPAAADVVWHRRRQGPSLSAATHPDDRAFARRENGMFADAIWQLSGPSAFWVNPEASAHQAEFKPVQLQLARQLGMAIPETLVSNDPARIRAFVERNTGRCIYKPLTHGDWQEEAGSRVLYTTGVNPADLPDDVTLQACPGIFQRRVDKHFEVRATFMGAHCMALRLDSQDTALGGLDWRRAQGSENIPAQAIALPEAVIARCRALMERLQLVFGCFDFIVTESGDWVFLEVNQMGQFLFLEAWCPELPVLDAFCSFLVSRDPSFSYSAPKEPVRFAELAADPELARRLCEGRARVASPEAWMAAGSAPQAQHA
jgi:hypothetical protein